MVVDKLEADEAQPHVSSLLPLAALAMAQREGQLQCCDFVPLGHRRLEEGRDCCQAPNDFR